MSDQHFGKLRTWTPHIDFSRVYVDVYVAEKPIRVSDLTEPQLLRRLLIATDNDLQHLIYNVKDELEERGARDVDIRIGTQNFVKGTSLIYFPERSLQKILNYEAKHGGLSFEKDGTPILPITYMVVSKLGKSRL